MQLYFLICFHALIDDFKIVKYLKYFSDCEICLNLRQSSICISLSVSFSLFLEYNNKIIISQNSIVK